MAGLFDKQASLYAAARPHYPASLFSFLASCTAHHHRAWDVGTGSGQAASAISELYRTVIATDVSATQLQHAPKKHNITYALTPAYMSPQELECIVGPEGSVDLVTMAQALHWFDLNAIYPQIKHVLKKPRGVLAAWCYREPSVDSEVDAVFDEFYRESGPFWERARWIVDDEYESLPFPFEPVAGHDKTGPFHFEAHKEMRVEDFLTYMGSMSVLQCARKQGVELLPQSRKEAFQAAWGDGIRTATFPIFMRIGCVG